MAGSGGLEQGRKRIKLSEYKGKGGSARLLTQFCLAGRGQWCHVSLVEVGPQELKPAESQFFLGCLASQVENSLSKRRRPTQSSKLAFASKCKTGR
jgi:hypothetical protein